MDTMTGSGLPTMGLPQVCEEQGAALDLAEAGLPPDDAQALQFFSIGDQGTGGHAQRQVAPRCSPLASVILHLSTNPKSSPFLFPASVFLSPHIQRTGRPVECLPWGVWYDANSARSTETTAVKVVLLFVFCKQVATTSLLCMQQGDNKRRQLTLRVL